MNENETTALVRAFDRAYINGKFVTPHGTQVVDLVNPTNNTVIGKVTMADEIDTRFRCPEFSPCIAQKTMELRALPLANILGWVWVDL
jgi:hypothetical protein